MLIQHEATRLRDPLFAESASELINLVPFLPCQPDICNEYALLYIGTNEFGKAKSSFFTNFDAFILFSAPQHLGLT